MFYKSFKQQFYSSIAKDPILRSVFNDMCALADRDGVVDMDYPAIAAVTRWSIEIIVAKIHELMQPDPHSRSKKFDGARLALIDSGRPWGWRIVNYELYRNMRNTEDRRTYMRDLMRNKRRERRRKQALAPVSNVSTPGGKCPPMSTNVHECPQGHDVLAGQPDLPGQTVSTPLAPVSTREHPLAHAEAEAYNTPCRPPGGGQPAARLITTFDEAKRLICERILNGKDPARPWSYQAQEALSRQLPIPLIEIERIAWFRGLPEDPKVPELVARKPITENGLCMFWSDEVTRANAFWLKIHGRAELEGKKEPPRWEEFFRWRHGSEVALPDSFYQLDAVRQREYEREFQTFVKVIEA